jgi:hypothetical protein
MRRTAMDDEERYWREKIAAEVEAFGDELLENAGVRATGVAVRAVVREAADRVRRREDVHAYAVTVKLPRDPTHDPANKITGVCALPDGGTCTDVTGQHHTYLTWSDRGIEHVREDATRRGFTHVTRIEEVAV